MGRARDHSGDGFSSRGCLSSAEETCFCADHGSFQGLGEGDMGSHSMGTISILQENSRDVLHNDVDTVGTTKLYT